MTQCDHSKRCVYLGPVHPRELAIVYKQTLGTVVYASNDCNPRVIYESIIMDRPFFATTEAQLPPQIESFGHVIEFNAEDAGEELTLFVNALDKQMWGDRPRKFAETRLREPVAYGKVLDQIDKLFWG